MGFADDYLKIVRRSHHGLLPRYKMGWQILIAIVVGVILLFLATTEPPLYNTRLVIPFFKRAIPDLHWFYVAFAVFVLVGSTNAVNLTDGLDGLAISVFAVAAGAFTALAYVSGHREFAEYLQLDSFLSPDGRTDGLLRRRLSAQVLASSGGTHIPPRSSWATSARWRSEARSGRSRC